MFHVEQNKTHIKTKDFFLTKEGFPIIKTEQEGLLKTDPAPPKEEIQKYYKAEDYHSHNSKSDGLFSFFYRLARVRRCGRRLGPVLCRVIVLSLLEVPCAQST